MSETRKYGIYVVWLVVGSFSGYLVFHPYIMVVNYLAHPQGQDLWPGNLYNVFLSSLEPHMFFMAGAFAFFGCLIGLFISLLFERRRRLHIIELESERKKAEIETLRKIMVTLSHYLLNSNTVIGGMARHARKNETNRDTVDSLDLVLEQARRIDAVIAILKRITEIKTADYTSKGHALMIDIAEELEKTLQKEASQGNGTQNMKG
ncbi:MAG: hypothetical protein HY809_04035 [Nitrospirae bacterium]|nr:hypothetical protein [Nitrospirota bacterium]